MVEYEVKGALGYGPALLPFHNGGKNNGNDNDENDGNDDYSDKNDKDHHQ